MRSWTDAAVSNPTGQQKVTAQLCHTRSTRCEAPTPPRGQGVMSRWDPRTSERAPEPTGHYRHLGSGSGLGRRHLYFISPPAASRHLGHQG